MTSAAIAYMAFWGFLVGFVGWTSCLRLVGPIADWLIPVRSEATVARGIVQFLVVLFLINAVGAALAILPIISFVSGSRDGTTEWRDVIGVTVVSSLVGFFSCGLIGRLYGKKK